MTKPTWIFDDNPPNCPLCHAPAWWTGGGGVVTCSDKQCPLGQEELMPTTWEFLVEFAKQLEGK